MPATKPTIYLIAGCNGAGKTTFAKEFLPKEVKCLRFLNADEIARGLSPLKPSAGAVRAARLLLTQVDECLRRRETFALESTLSGKTYVRLFRRAPTVWLRNRTALPLALQRGASHCSCPETRCYSVTRRS